MNLKNYFEETNGIGVLSTSDEKGNVDSAIYARPHIVENGEVVFIMADKLSHSNLQKNPNACYLFKQEGAGYTGKRLYLKKIRETQDQEQIEHLRRSCHCLCDNSQDSSRFLVFFSITNERPLTGVKEGSKKVCTTCLKPAGDHGHLCAPGLTNDEKCDWCGAVIPDHRHLCDDKVKALTYVCNSCGRSAVKAEHLCNPTKIQ